MFSPPPKHLGDLNGELGTEIVTIFVGKKRKEFKISKSLICAKSDFFKKAFIGYFKKGRVVMHLHEDNAEVFAIFVTWLYGGGIIGGKTSANFLNLFELYFFAEKIRANALANHTIDKIEDMYWEEEETIHAAKFINRVDENTTDGPHYVDSILLV